ASAIVPLAGADVEERAIRVQPDRARIAAAPRIDVDDTLSVAEERRLYEHYGLAYSHEASSTVLPEGAAAGGADGTAAQPAEERPRLRKYVGAPVPPPASGDESGDTAPPAPDADADADAAADAG